MERDGRGFRNPGRWKTRRKREKDELKGETGQRLTFGDVMRESPWDGWMDEWIINLNQLALAGV